jgi:DNA-directed RNA polymerase subunit RPC12/RpoP
MNCPNCGRELPMLAAMLADTEKGTQCPKCWTRLRRPKVRGALARIKKLPALPLPLRRAA